MAKSANETLLAILLAIDSLAVPLSVDEQAALRTTGQMLAKQPETWESATETLLEAFQANGPFLERYQEAMKGLENLQGKITLDLLPTEEELKQALPPKRKVVKRAYFEGKPDQVSNEILNFVTAVLDTPDPASTISKLKNALNKIISKADKSQ